MALRISDEKPVYVIITLGVHERDTPKESPDVVRRNLEEWGVNGAFVLYNRGFSGTYAFFRLKDGSPGYFKEIQDSKMLKHGIVFNCFGKEFFDEKSPICIPREYSPTPEFLEGWIDPYKLKEHGPSFDLKYRSIIDNLRNYVDRDTMVLFDFVRYPNRRNTENDHTEFCPNCALKTWENHVTNVTEATGILVSYMSRNTPINKENFLGVVHTPRDHKDHNCMKAWNLGQAYDDSKGLTRYLRGGVAMLVYYAPTVEYIKDMVSMAKKGYSYSGYSTSGTEKSLYFLMSVEQPNYWTSNLQTVIDKTLYMFDGIILYNYRSLVEKGGVERV